MQLRITDLSHAFGSRQLFDHLSLTAGSHEMIALMGPSGAGKSTLLSIIAGALKPDRGSFDCAPRNPRTVWIVQSTPLLPRRTGLENVRLGPLGDGASLADANARSLAAMERLGIVYTADTKVFRLSGGERQRLAVARAMASSADLILADEPTASLDPQARSDVIAALRAVADHGAAVIVSTHDPAVADLCDWVAHLTGGALQSTAETR